MTCTIARKWSELKDGWVSSLDSCSQHANDLGKVLQKGDVFMEEWSVRFTPVALVTSIVGVSEVGVGVASLAPAAASAGCNHPHLSTLEVLCIVFGLADSPRSSPTAEAA